MKIVEFPRQSPVDIPQSLRHLAEQIEKGEHGECHNLVWVIDEGEGVLSIGLLGQAPEAGVLAYYMMGKAMRHLEG